MASVFNRLGSNEKVHDAAGRRTSREGRPMDGDLRGRLSGESMEEKCDGQSSKGSRSPPSVFERLSGHIQPSP
ncbi:unnamed protein product [Brassica oleracea]